MGQPQPGGYQLPPGGPPAHPRAKTPGWVIAVIVAGTLTALACFGGVTAALVGGIKAGEAPPRVLDTRDPLPKPGITVSPVPVEPKGPPPADETYSGRGNKVIDIDLDEDWRYIAKIKHVGSSNFIVETRDARGRYVDGIVNKIGDYDGLRLLDVRVEETPKSLSIRADGRWTVTVQVADKAPKWTGKASGSDDAILAVDPQRPASEIRFTHRGRDNCTLLVLGESPDLLVNEIGRYSAETTLPEGTRFIDIGASGSWTLTEV